jgi:hypothetical protein
MRACRPRRRGGGRREGWEACISNDLRLSSFSVMPPDFESFPFHFVFARDVGDDVVEDVV